jgi:hypothetical protein
MRMDGIVVLDLVMAVIVVVVVVGRPGARRLRRACRAIAQIPSVPRPRSGDAVPERVPEGEALESVLAARVVYGQVSRGAYQRRMAELAAAEHDGRPLIVPRP